MSKGILFLTLFSLSFHSFADKESICGINDDRTLSFDSKIGRLSIEGQYKGCTATLISDSCAISAGHCLSVLDVVEFNTLPSVNGEPTPSDPKDTYKIDKDSIVYEEGSSVAGNDYAVFKIKPNSITGNLPGTVQGYYPVSYAKPQRGDIVRITGYGVAPQSKEGNFAQQTHTGKITALPGFFKMGAGFSYDVDTTGGNSGSSVILERTGEIIGIHALGGCHSTGGANEGTLISKHKKLMDAIKRCIAQDKR